MCISLLCILYVYVYFVFFAFSGFLPVRRYASAYLCDSNVSVRLSVTRRYCVKTKKARVVISSPSGSSTILAKCHPDILWGSPRAGPQTVWGWKIQPFSSFKHQYLENGSR